MTSWLARAWSLLKAMPLILGGIAVAVAAVMAARRSSMKARREIRTGSLAHLPPDMPAPERARQIREQVERLERAQAHVKSAEKSRRVATAAASRIETAGHPSVAEIVRSWNRE